MAVNWPFTSRWPNAASNNSTRPREATRASRAEEDEGRSVHKFCVARRKNKEGPNENPTASGGALPPGKHTQSPRGAVRLNSVDGQHSRQLSAK